jgi:hypothetical protein
MCHCSGLGAAVVTTVNVLAIPPWLRKPLPWLVQKLHTPSCKHVSCEHALIQHLTNFLGRLRKSYIHMNPCQTAYHKPLPWYPYLCSVPRPWSLSRPGYDFIFCAQGLWNLQSCAPVAPCLCLLMRAGAILILDIASYIYILRSKTLARGCFWIQADSDGSALDSAYCLTMGKSFAFDSSIAWLAISAELLVITLTTAL